MSDLPFFENPSLQFQVPLLGTVDLELFGVLAASGMVAGTWLIQKVGGREGFDSKTLFNLVLWTAVSALICARFFHILAYDLEGVAEIPGRAFRLRGGVSSMGGLIGCGVGFFGYLRRHRLGGKSRRSYADLCSLGGLLGLVFVRMGCTLHRDHPGTPTDFFLGFEFEDGSMRHNLGFYELICCMVLLVCLLLVRRQWNGRPPGALAAVAAVAYGGMRFFLDFLRATRSEGGDERFWGLTPGQYVAIALLVTGAVTLRSAFEHGRECGHV